MTKKLKYICCLMLSFCMLPPFAFADDVTLAWDAPANTDIAGYRVFVREGNENFDFDFPEWEGSLTICTLSGFDPFETYHFIVRAFNSNGNESDNSNEVTWQPAGGAIQSNIGQDYSTDAQGGGCFINSVR